MNAMLTTRPDESTLKTQDPVLLTFSLHLDPTKGVVLVEGEDIKAGIIPVPNGLALLQLTVCEADVLRGVRLPTNPIEWFSSDRQPIPTPAPFTVARDSDFQAIVLDINRATQPTPFPFTISVFFEGKLFSSEDPSILNRPPA